MADPQADMTFTLDETTANDPRRDAMLAQLMQQPPAPPDPRSALDAYNAPAQPMNARNYGQQHMQSIDELAADRQAALAAQAKATYRADSERAQMADDRATQARGAGVDAAMAHESHKTERDDIRAQYEQLQQRVANTRIEDTQSKVMGALAIGLSGPAHYRDTIAQLDKQTDRKLQIQRDNLANQKDAAGMKLNELHMARQFFNDDMQASEFIRASDREAYGAELERVAAQLGDATAQANAASLGAQIKADGIAEKAALFAKRAAAGARRNRPMTEKDRLANEQTALENEKLRRGLNGSDAGASAELAGYESTQKLSAGDQSTARQIDSATNALEQDYRDLAAIRERNKDGATWNQTDVNEARRILNSMPSKFSQTFGAGAPSKDEMATFKDTLVDPTGVHPLIDAKEAYARGAQSIRGQASARLQSYGYRPKGSSTLPPEVQANIRALKSKFSFKPAGQ